MHLKTSSVNQSFLRGRTQTLHVYDISNKDVIAGVEIVSKELALSKTYSLVVCSNVLEHVPYPSDLLVDILRAMDTDSVLYIEVPLEDVVRCNENDLHFKKRHWHEHINFFSEKALKRLVEGVGLEVVAFKELAANVGGKASYLFQVACKLAPH